MYTASTGKLVALLSRCLVALLLLLWVEVGAARAADVIARVGDVTHLKGQRINRLLGQGLVVGLDGTGDGDSYAPSIRALAGVLRKYSNPVQGLDELKDTKNVALVWVSAVTPENGGREGDRLNVRVSTFGAAKSLAGGWLLPAPLVFHDPSVQSPVYAFAGGRIELSDPKIKTSGVIRKGATLEEDILVGFYAYGRELPYSNDWIKPQEKYITLVLENEQASWALASEIAVALNDELSDVAMVGRAAVAVDPKNVVVLLPKGRQPARWISDIQMTRLLMPSSEARVIINRTSGTIVVSGDARISPVVISKRGLTITVAAGELTQPDTVMAAQTQRFVPVDPAGAGGGNVASLLKALNRLNVSIDDRIDILEEIHRQGKLHAKLMREE
ncbi:MAG: flagellar basal body P-ring protein FlgI [Phycisphaerae bacterium]|nr:flagellar basal body P-ring protein FlgI [Phycisphaerae bacterium]